ncbi:MAG: hypothetical protein ABF430_12270 [Acetobacter persici]|uniref:phage baseplate plug family protein n=1 Tax=Acetobacter persici TaxID=1076596 RepID=UPI0039EB144B
MADPVVIPLSAVAYQSLKLTLSGRAVQLDIQQRTNGLYATIWLDGTMILAGIVCQDRTWIVRRAYLGMPGDLVFIDQYGQNDPDYTGLGARYVLMYEAGKNV